MNPIFAQALAPWTPQAPSKTDRVTRALILGLTEAEVEACKAEAMKYVPK